MGAGKAQKEGMEGPKYERSEQAYQWVHAHTRADEHTRARAHALTV